MLLVNVCMGISQEDNKGYHMCVLLYCLLNACMRAYIDTKAMESHLPSLPEKNLVGPWNGQVGWLAVMIHTNMCPHEYRLMNAFIIKIVLE